jgi:ADP-heptose:LPS heptosyltransferase
MMALCDAAVLLFSPSKGAKAGVAVIKLDAIGDFILWLDSAKELKRNYPARKITLIANTVWADLAERLPYWDEVWPVNVSRLRETRYSSYRARLLRAIRGRSFDVAVQPTYSREFLVGDALIRASGARTRTGSTGDEYNITAQQKRISDRWYTRLLPANEMPATELDRNAEFVRNLGIEDFRPSAPILPTVAQLPDRLRIGNPYVVLFPGAGWSGRQWPADRFAEVANYLHAEMGITAVVCGSAAESSLCQKVAEVIDAPAINFAGETSLPEFVELVRGAELLVGNETSAIHIAAAVGTPSACILGGGHYGRFLPYAVNAASHRTPELALHSMNCFGCDWHCTQPHDRDASMPCIEGVSVQDVLLAIKRALNTRLFRFLA